jgi:hypothetical protein
VLLGGHCSRAGRRASRMLRTRRGYAPESPLGRTVIVACLLNLSAVRVVWPSGAVTLVTTHALPSRSNLSPTPKTLAVSQYSVRPSGKKIVS